MQGWRKPMPVLVRINEQPEIPWRINMMPMGDGSFYLYLHGDVRKVSETKVGDRVRVELSFDSDYTGGPTEMPPQLTLAFKKYPMAKLTYDALIPSRQKEIVRYLTNLKSLEALERNIIRVLDVLSGKKGRFMGRNW
jgi:hypothetical protein